MNFNLEIDWPTLFVSLGIIVFTFIAAYLFQRFFNRFILNSTRLLKNDPTNYKFLKHVLVSIIYVVGFSMAIYRIEYLQVLASSLLAGAGILAVAVGFASQAALSNVISGLFIIVFKPYRINDRVTVKDNLRGIVEDITLRHTVIRDFENRRIIIPNTVMSEEVIVNADMADEKVCRFVEIGISYDSDVKKAKQIMREEVVKHPMHIDARTPEQVEKGKDEAEVRVIGLGESSVNLRAWAWAANQAEGFNMHCDLLESIKERFDAEGIEIPFPYRTVVFKNAIEIETKTEDGTDES